MRRSHLLLLTFLLILSACDEIKKKPKEPKKREGLISQNGFPASATNLSIVNSAFDDYNSAKQGDGSRSTFIFSSNRNSKGENFDIVQYNMMNVYYDFESGIATIDTDTHYYYGSWEISEMLKKVNTQENEFGPYIFDLEENSEFLLFYAQEKNGKLDLKFMTRKLYSKVNYFITLISCGPYNVNLLNTSKYDEAYISIQDHVLYYCSDASGDFDIYSYEIDKAVDTGTEYIDLLKKKSTTAALPIIRINSDSDDKCPFIVDDLLIFASNREGGYGGYDLWYSRLVHGVWTEPKNFGDKINSKYDEFRPILSKYDSPSDLMIFSSNRPGGMGGFDLYYVGIKETKERIK